MILKTKSSTDSTFKSDRLSMHFKNLLKSRILHNISIVFASSMSARAINVVSIWILVRHLSPSEYGIFSILDMVAGFSVGILTLGFNQLMIKSIAEFKTELDKAWSIAWKILKIELIYGSFLAGGIYLFAEPISTEFFKKPELTPFLRLCSIGIFSHIIFQYRSSLFRAFSRFKNDALYTISQALIYLLVISLLLLFGIFGVYPAAIAYVSIPAFVGGVAFYTIHREILKGRKVDFPDFTKRIGSDYMWLLCYALSLWLIQQLHIIILTRHVAMSELGLYGFSYKIYGITLMLLNSINIVLLPTVSEKKELPRLKDTFKKITLGTAAISCCFLLTLPFWGWFVHVFAGEQYKDAVNIIRIFIFGTAMSTLLSPATNILFAVNDFKKVAIGGLLSVFINIIGHVLITPRFGGMGAATVQVTSYFFLCLWMAFYAVRRFKNKKQIF